MSSADWKPTILRKSKPQGKIVQSGVPVGSQQVRVGGTLIKLSKDSVATLDKGTGNRIERVSITAFKKLDGDDPSVMKEAIPTVSKSLGLKISQARVAKLVADKPMTRKQLAASINELESVVAGMENGTALYRQAILTKINKTLGTALKRND